MPSVPVDATSRLRDAFAQHAAPGDGVTLAQMADPAWTGLAPEPEMIALLLAQPPAIAPFLREQAPKLAPRLREQLVRWVQAKNQFIDFEPDTLRDIEVAFRRRLEMLAECISAPQLDTDAKAEGVREAFRAAHRSLAGILRVHLGKDPREVPNHEYTPELQLRLLGFSLDSVAPPILDIGCGAHANLVRALRAAGLAAEGLDRDVPAELGTQIDWRRFDFPADHYGTIVSHQAFSLHFLHQELGKKDAAFAYAKIYMAILRALRVGGTFAYAPGLPFIEGHLSAKSYRCERVELPDELRETPMLRALGEHLGDDVAYAARVRRIA